MRSPSALHGSTLLALRWAGTAVLLAVLSVGATGWLAFPGWTTATAILATSVAVNVIGARIGPRYTGLLLVADTAILTWMLATSGGVSNPFTLLYLLPVLVAALATSVQWTALLTLLTTVAFGMLYWYSPAHHHMDMSHHLFGMIAAYALTVPLLAVGVHRFRSAAEEADRERARAHESREMAERLTSLAALAGGAAHELSQPLSAILLVARELERDAAPGQKDDLVLIADQVLQCRDILTTLAVDAGGAGVPWTHVDLPEFIAAAVRDYDVSLTIQEGTAKLPRHLVAQALRRLVGNAVEAGAKGVTIQTACADDELEVTVQDDGPGMPAEVLRRACDPFFTTRPHGNGRGLGLFFVHSLAQQLEGSFRLVSQPGHGTTAILKIPLEPA